MHDRTKRFLRDALDEALALQDDMDGASLREFTESRQLQ